MPYTEGFKARMIERMAGAERISATTLAQEVGVPQPTLSRWLRERPLRRVNAMKNEKKRAGAKKWTAEQKLRVVLEATGLPDEELGAYLRREGLHEGQLKEWIEAATMALSAKPKSRGKNTSPEAKRVRELEKDLLRKDKALAEVTALLVLKKKLEAIWGDEDESTDTRSGT